MPDMNDVQGELMDMIIADKSPSQISDRIKDMLFAKSAERVDNFRPNVASSVFDGEQSEEEIEQGELSLTVFLGLSHLFVNSKIQEQSIDLEDIKEIKEICKQKKTGARSSGFFPILIGEINKYLDAKSKS